MNLIKFMENYANEVNGKYSEYDDNKSVIIVPLKDQRFQSVVGEKKHVEQYGREGIEFSSKVCRFDSRIDLQQLMAENTKFWHAKFAIVDDHIQVEASTFLDNVSEGLLKEMIEEVANAADDWEFKLTGKDVN